MISRQLAAILFADIMGYTALMQEDEEQALLLRYKLKGKIEKELALHNGRLMDFRGDGAVCCFSSAIEAVRAAVAIQLDMQQEPKVPLRIGIHTGDVIVDELDVYGDGVNIASRLESFAVPGSIFISSKVRDDIKNQKDIQTVSLGQYSFKNVDGPVEIFAISNPGLNVPVKEKLEGKGKRFSPGYIKARKVFWSALLLTLSVALIIVFFLNNKRSSSEISNKAKSIAVLPFRNESTNKEENEFFCNGMMESVLNNLAQMEALHVISRQSVEQYRGSKKSIRSIANELGVAFILAGSVQRIGNNVKVTAQLIDAGTDRYLWSQEYPGELNDIFTLQSNIAQKIASELQVNIRPNEKERIERLPTKNLQAWDEYQKAYSSYVRFVFSVDRKDTDFKQILLLCNRALALDPRMAEAYTLKAQTYWSRYYGKDAHHVNEELLAANSMDTIAAWCRKALAIDQHSAEANVLLGQYYINRGKQDSGISYLQQALAVNPNHSAAHSQMGSVFLERGEITKAFTYSQKAIKLDPVSLWAPFIYNQIAWIYVTVGDFRKAEMLYYNTLQLEKSSSATVEALSQLAHTYIVEGNAEKVLEVANKRLQLDSTDSTALRSIGEYYCTFKRDYPRSNTYFQELFRVNPNITHTKQRWALTLWLWEKKDTALILFREYIEEYQKLVRLGRIRMGVADYDIAGIYATLGQREKAYHYLRSFDQAGWPWGSIYLIQRDPFFDNLRKDKEFNEVIQKALKEKEKQRKEIEVLEEA